jgi:hypothetical protein
VQRHTWTVVVTVSLSLKPNTEEPMSAPRPTAAHPPVGMHSPVVRVHGATPHRCCQGLPRPGTSAPWWPGVQREQYTGHDRVDRAREEE